MCCFIFYSSSVWHFVLAAETHFKVVVVSSEFDNKSLLKVCT